MCELSFQRFQWLLIEIGKQTFGKVCWTKFLHIFTNLLCNNDEKIWPIIVERRRICKPDRCRLSLHVFLLLWPTTQYANFLCGLESRIRERANQSQLRQFDKFILLLKYLGWYLGTPNDLLPNYLDMLLEKVIKSISYPLGNQIYQRERT